MTVCITTGRVQDKVALQRLGFLILDITAKSGDSVFAPLWELVQAYRKGYISETQYTAVYRDLMRASYRDHRHRWEQVLNQAEGQTLALLCYCPRGRFCHRLLLMRYLALAGRRLGFQVRKIKERRWVKPVEPKTKSPTPVRSFIKSTKQGPVITFY
jgi:uncharacterized protein YeaO (DUF488 family)